MLSPSSCLRDNEGSTIFVVTILRRLLLSRMRRLVFILGGWGGGGVQCGARASVRSVRFAVRGRARSVCLVRHPATPRRLANRI